MDKKEMLYELSLKYNTLKMYNNTIEQMRNNGCSDKKINDVIAERDIVEKEVMELLKPDAQVNESHRKCPTIANNKFLDELNKSCEYRELYDVRKNFFDDIKPLDGNKDQIAYRKSEISEDKKPVYADIQEKISTSQWISCSNFIVKFPKDKINIDEWRISGVHYTMRQSSKYSCGSRERLSVMVNDFAEMKNDGEYVILADIVNKLYSYGVNVIGNVDVDVINNNGVILYTLRFTNCIFEDADCDSFSYQTTDLRRFNLNFSYDNIEVIPPVKK